MLRAALLTLFILIVLPASASAACRTAPVRDVWYDSPAVQVWFDNHGAVACVRATGTERVVRTGDGDIGLEFHDVYGERWLRTGRYTGYESDTTSIEWLSDDMLDLWTGQTVTADGLPVPGGYVTSGAEGIVARYTDGRTEVVDPAPGVDFALQGKRLYWNTAAGPRTALLNLPDPGPRAERPFPPARRMTRCTPRPGARLVVRFRRIVVTRKGSSAFVCFNGRTTALGNATRFQRLTSSDLAYTRPGYTGIIDAATGKRRELPRGSGPLAADLWTIAAQDRKGVLRAWGDARRPVVLSRKPASEIAVAPYAVYWLAADGTPRVAEVR